VPSRVIAALCAVAAAVALIVAVSARRDSSRLRGQLAALSDVAKPGSRVVYLKRGQTDAGVAVVVRRGAAPLLVSKLARAPAGRVYQVWTIADNGATPVSAGLLAGGGDIVIHLSGTYAPGTTIAITVEPGGGSKAPTSAPIMAGSTS
jgi:anti-sigma-K factor RskA